MYAHLGELLNVSTRLRCLIRRIQLEGLSLEHCVLPTHPLPPVQFFWKHRVRIRYVIVGEIRYRLFWALPLHLALCRLELYSAPCMDEKCCGTKFGNRHKQTIHTCH